MDAKTFESAVIKKVGLRILPLILISYCVAYIDRANIAVAALTMNRDLGFSAFTYGLGAGIFFLGYFLFEVPSNLILERVGARRWIARIMFTWGILSASCAFVTGPTSFIIVGFLLGVAEAGFFPGVVLYFTYLFPDRFRGRILAMLFLAIPFSNALSNLVSGAILDVMNGLLGLQGWQWVFIVEAAPAVLLSFVVLRNMIDRPSLATWLEPNERHWLEKELNDERAKAEGPGRLTLGKVLDGPPSCRTFGHLVPNGDSGLWDGLLPAANRKGSWLVQFHEWRRISDSLSRRHGCTVDLGLVERSNRRSSVALHRRFGHRRDWIRGSRGGWKLLLVARGYVACASRNLWCTPHVLAASLDVPERDGRRSRHCADQFDWKPRRLCRTIHRRLDQGFDEQLRDGTLFSGRMHVGIGRACLLCQEGLRTTGRST